MSSISCKTPAMELPTLLQKREVSCVGDKIMHNEVLDSLFFNAEKAKYYDSVVHCLCQFLDEVPQRWIIHYITRGEAKRINMIMRSSNDELCIKRIEAHIRKLVHGTRYGFVFNKRQAQCFGELLKELKGAEKEKER